MSDHFTTLWSNGLTMLYLYLDDILQLSVGQVCICLNASNGIDLKLSWGSWTFHISCLFRFVVVKDIFLQFTLRHGTIILLQAKQSPLVCKIEWKWKANQCDERVFIFEIAIKYFPIWIIAGKRRERGYISDNHLNQTG